MREARDVTHWPDMFQKADFVLLEREDGQVYADVESDQAPADMVYLTIPMDYRRPLDRSPLHSIDDSTMLSDAGEVIYEVVEVIDSIVMSPYPEFKARQRLAGLLRNLDNQYGYTPAIIRNGLIGVAQLRGDFPQTTEE